MQDTLLPVKAGAWQVGMLFPLTLQWPEIKWYTPHLKRTGQNAQAEISIKN
jgi:hypothetical protein